MSEEANGQAKVQTVGLGKSGEGTAPLTTHSAALDEYDEDLQGSRQKLHLVLPHTHIVYLPVLSFSNSVLIELMSSMSSTPLDEVRIAPL